MLNITTYWINKIIFRAHFP